MWNSVLLEQLSVSPKETLKYILPDKYSSNVTIAKFEYTVNKFVIVRTT